MSVLWTVSAEQDCADIVEFIAQDNPLAAIRMDELLGAAVGRLAEHPLMGRPGQIAGTRALMPHESYRLIHETRANVVWILALVHTARRWPPTRS